MGWAWLVVHDRTESDAWRFDEDSRDKGGDWVPALQALWDAAEDAAVKALAVLPNDPELHLFRVAVSLPTTHRLSKGARSSLDWLQSRDTHLRLPHTAMMMIPALIYEDRFDQADKVLDNASRWTEQSGDIWVIERLRGNVAAERAVD